MKLSIKYKIPILLLIMFIFYAFAFRAYSSIFVFKHVKSDISSIWSQFEESNMDIVSGIVGHYPDSESTKRFLDDISSERNMRVSVYDASEKRVYHSDHIKTKGFSIRNRDVAVIDGNIKYVLDIEYPMALKDFKEISSVRNMQLFAVIMLFLMISALIIYLHYSIAKPLTALHDTLSTINYHNTKVSITYKKSDEIGDLYKNFEEMGNRLENSHIQQIESISAISHDLKTPLTSIMGYVERLSGGKVKSEEKSQEYYSIIYKKARDIEMMIEEFSDFTKNELDLVNLSKERVSVKEFFTSLCSEYSEELQSFHTAFSWKSSAGENVLMDVDVKKLRRVFANLVSNSLKYCGDSVSINLTCSTSGHRVFFRVEDNGQGIPEEELPKIFDKFYRVDKSRSREGGGIGLGLAICRSIVESHGGDIEAYNVEGGGLGISFSLPLKI